MKLVLVTSLIIAAVVADRLENKYLPPTNAVNAGGDGEILNTPNYQVLQREYQPQSDSKNINTNNYYRGGLTQTKSADDAVTVLRSTNENNGDGNYRYEVETSNGIYTQEQGQLQNKELVISGSYSYIAPDGQKITVTYIADSNGFHPEGDHLPTPPPIPEAIIRSLQRTAPIEVTEARAIPLMQNGGPSIPVKKHHEQIPYNAPKQYQQSYAPRIQLQNQRRQEISSLPPAQHPTSLEQCLPSTARNGAFSDPKKTYY